MGDKNTGFFHASTEKRKAINKFAVLETEEGISVYKEEEIAATIEEYYTKMFTSNKNDPHMLASIIGEATLPRVSEEQNDALTKIPSPQEIKEALFSIHPDKAPEPDGFSACFFSKELVSGWRGYGERSSRILYLR